MVCVYKYIILCTCVHMYMHIYMYVWSYADILRLMIDHAPSLKIPVVTSEGVLTGL